MKILFVCKGNVGRSQMAEALYKLLGNKNHEVFSAGITLSGPEESLKSIPADYVIKVIAEEGADISEAFRTQITPEMMDSADKIIVIVEESYIIPEYFKNNPKVKVWNVEDPKGTDLETHRKIKDQIKELI